MVRSRRSSSTPSSPSRASSPSSARSSTSPPHSTVSTAATCRRWATTSRNSSAIRQFRSMYNDQRIYPLFFRPRNTAHRFFERLAIVFDLALERVLMLGRYEGVPRRLVPTLVGLREEVSSDGEYSLVLQFKHKKGFLAEQWTKRIDKITTFFEPGIKTAEMAETEEGAEITLTSDGSGEGRGGGEKGEVLPPLMPGLPARDTQ